MKTFLVLFFSISLCALNAQVIFLDGQFNDWSNPDLVIEDGTDNPSAINVDKLEVQFDDEYVYFKIELDREILLQQNNDILLGVDFDANPQTGLDHGNIGAEWVFNFGNRSGFLFNGGILLSEHDDVGLVAAPTVSSEVFEVALLREFRKNGINFRMGDEINVHISTQGEFGDWAPSSGIASLDISAVRPIQVPQYQLAKDASTEFRFVSYNVLRDNIFKPSVQNDFRRLMQAVDADVYCFQEIYDNDENDLLDLMLDLDILDNTLNWYAAKKGPDLIMISRYPIVFDQAIGNNSIQVVDVDGQDVFIVNTHLPCCENDLGREIEIDQILQYIRRAKDNTVGYNLEENTPIIICGDMNLVGQSSQLEALIEGDIFDNSFFGPDVTMDWDGSSLEDLTAPTTGFPAAFTWYSPFSSFFPGRLDFVLFTDSRLEVLNSFVLNSQGLDQSEQTQYQILDGASLNASDHMPVVADFKIKTSVSTTEASFDFHVDLYPNPAEGTFNIRSQEILVKINCLTMDGRIVRQVVPDNKLTQIELPTGVYLIEIINSQGKRTVEKLTVF